MSRARVLWSLVVAFGVGLINLSGTNDTFAQEASSADVQPPSEERDASATSIEAERQDALTRKQRAQSRRSPVDAASIPPAEKRSQVRTMLNEQRSARDRASSLYAEARNQNDMLQVNCVSDKLTQIKGLLRVSQRAEDAMSNALEGNKGDEANHNYNQITLAHQRSGQLRAEAEQCVGELSVFTGQTEVEVDIDPSISRIDPTQPVLPPPGPQTPALASEVDGQLTVEP